MIIKLLPNQISNVWEYIRLGILNTPSPLMDVSPESIRNILRSLLIGEMQCWLAIKKIDGKDEVFGYILTSIYTDIISKTRLLNIYDIYAFRTIDKEIITAGLSAINGFAKANNCKKLTAYSDIGKIIDLATTLGFKTSARLLTMEVR